VLIVAANIAGLLAVRSTERQFEVSLRLTLGANRWQIARQVLIEVMLLAVAGGVAALFVANVSRQMLAKYSPLPVTNARSEIAIVLFELFLCLITGLACAAIPAWMASRTDPGLRLQEGGHQRTAAASKNLLRHGFVVGQVAVATTLLVCGGLFLHSILRLLAAPLGFNPQNVLTMRISIPRALYLTPESRQRFYTSVIDSVGRTPGVASASGCDTLPFGWDDATEVTFEIVGKERGTAQSIAVNDVYPGYFATLDIPLLRGRTFNSNDRAGAEPVAVIDQAAREQFFHEQDPVGQLIKFEVGNAFKVIGVTGAIKSAALDLKSRPTIYLSALTGKPRNLYLLVRSSLPQAALLSAIQRAVVNVDKDRPVYDVLPLQTRIDNALETRRFVVSLVTLFAALGAVLAGLGLYALLSHTILLRKREIGIRVALGATRLDVASFVARVGTSPVILGILGGSFSAFAAQRFIQSQLYATSMGDSAAWSAALFTVVLASASAIAIPVWRAVHFDAQQAMREE
jgi:predicted permease